MEFVDHFTKIVKNAEYMLENTDKPYHELSHTRQVVNSAMLLCTNIGVDEHIKKTVYLAAWFHDVGHYYSSDDHEQKSAEIAEAHLRAADVNHRIVEDVGSAIEDTDLDRSPGSFLPGQILCDADFSNLNFQYPVFKQNELSVRDEVAPEVDDGEWLRSFTSELLTEHEWHTDEAKELWDDQKQYNIRMLREEYGAEINGQA